MVVELGTFRHIPGRIEAHTLFRGAAEQPVVACGSYGAHCRGTAESLGESTLVSIDSEAFASATWLCWEGCRERGRERGRE